ncbi:glycerate kinase [Byssothecium circinans]|uniref:Glycerate kinase n=1 Tax=Byssothecium circinans TaxID=147558 RepID=A0A6A5TKY3_9PLEO|nr:glycerate kinase [Byssothecium circinans]
MSDRIWESEHLTTYSRQCQNRNKSRACTRVKAVPVKTTNENGRKIGKIPTLPRLSTLKTFNLPSQKVDDFITSATSTAIGTPTLELLGGQPLRVLIAPSGFKESIGPEHVADAIEAGLRRVIDSNSAIMRKLPLHDGGEGFCRALVAAKGGKIVEEVVTGPVGWPVESHLGFIGDDKKTAVLDMAAAAGLRLVPRDLRDPTVTTTYGIVIGCGDSRTSDGGAGLLQALGVRLLDADGQDLPKADGGRSLSLLDKLCWCDIYPRLRKDVENPVQIEAVCNIKNVLCGPKGVARVYGPQKGATPEQVELLAAALEHLAKVAEKDLGKDISHEPGSGASGGLGTGLMLLGARLPPRSEAISQYFEFDRSTQGKMTTEVSRRAKRHGAQVVALAGTIGEGADGCYGAGIKAFTSILRGPSSLEEAIAETERLVKDGAEKVMRMILVGLALGRRQT